MKIVPWKKIKEEVSFKKYSKKIIGVDFEMPDGSIGDYYLIDQGNAVATLAITKEGEVLLVKQYRPGPDEILLEIPGGLMNEGETSEVAALRELKEETGYFGDASHVSYVFDDAYSTMKRACVVVENCEKVSGQQLDTNEYIEIVKMPISEFREHIKTGKMTDVEIAYMGMDYLKLL